MDQKVALITGCSSGFGLLTAIEMRRAGYRVVATMRNLGKRAGLDAAAKEAGLSLDVRRLDITEYDSLPGFVEQLVGDHGRLDVLVNNAGFSVSGFAEDLTLQEIKLNFETNFFGHVAMTKAVLPVMRKQKSGHIIMLSSMAGLIAQPVVSTYCSTKHALEGWSEAVRIETHSLGIRVVLVEPGAFATDIWEKNVVMGQHATSPDSPNLQRSLRFRDFVRNHVAKADAREVARLIVRVANDPNPRLRYLIGKDAHAAYWMRRFLPWKRWERMVARHTGID
ncbi:MAG TPA: SDR family oxidoreductase [Terriglobales bacterium]|nr:SDR family oxidoreductase [Terriglobales bacterium]